MARKLRVAHAQPPAEQIGEAVVGGERFPLFRGLLVTHGAVQAVETPRLAQAYKRVFPGEPVPPRMHLVRVVGGLVQNQWYAQQGKEVPMTVKQQQATREAKAKAAGAAAAAAPAPPTPAAAAQPGRPRSNKKQAIRELIAQGLADEAIFEQLKAKFPNLTKFNVKWARAHPLKRGE